MGGQADAWADWCAHNARVGPGFTKEEYNQKTPATKEPPKPPTPKPKPPAGPQKPLFQNLTELLSDAGTDLLYAARTPLSEKPLAVVCAMVEEGRPEFLELLREHGVENLAHRQRVANALTKAVRAGRVVRGWAKAEPEAWETQCAHCRKKASETVKLSTCTRCKAVKYCGAACQRAAWPHHKGVCKRVEPTDTKIVEVPSGHKSWASATPDPNLLDQMNSDSCR